jgi:hypothetical protein
MGMGGPAEAPVCLITLVSLQTELILGFISSAADLLYSTYFVSFGSVKWICRGVLIFMLGT